MSTDELTRAANALVEAVNALDEYADALTSIRASDEARRLRDETDVTLGKVQALLRLREARENS